MGFGALAGLTANYFISGGVIDPSHILTWVSEAASNQITQAGTYFLIAAWIHSGRVKKEIKSNFASLTAAIDNVSKTFQDDLKEHRDILMSHGEILANLVPRVDTLEKEK